MSKYHEITQRAIQVFGNMHPLPKKFTRLLEDLEQSEKRLELAKINNCVQPGHYNNFNSVKAKIFDMLNDDGILIVGRLTKKELSI